MLNGIEKNVLKTVKHLANSKETLTFASDFKNKLKQQLL